MSPALHIAVVEDHADLRELFVEYLEDEGHHVAGFSYAEELDDFLPAHSIDLVVLDLNLPGEDGYSIARRLREAHPEVYIIMVTARTALDDRIRGYASGADLYLAKPVAPAELVAAVGSLGRRVSTAKAEQALLELDVQRMELTGPVQRVVLRQPDVLLLKALAEAPDHQLATWRLMELVNLEPADYKKGALEVRIFRLKKKLLEAGAPAPSIRAVWKVGYQLCTPMRVRG
ncbi:MAG: response regulator transcription factor [Rhodoferax sp.]